ncbi:probable peptidoglycan muropeptide transporter SLC46 [Saccostrea echinata]|uniref:probable peptidoglycan muropeptide transporter SLC46 n=1 Tax=Saccostrea echinata TaxID=191078 RepID=UPI002A80A4FB|nr:probable peptidoglycan muropeptide transporter SLC46 [Saccostrea echinata]
MLSCGSSIIVVYIVFFLYKTGESMLDATTLPYLVRAVCYKIFKDNENSTMCMNLDKNHELEDIIQKQSGNYLIYHRLLQNIPAIAVSLFCGSYSDRYGRKIPTVLPNLGTIFAVVLYFASNLVPEYRIGIFLSGSALQGLFGNRSVITMAVYGLVFDLSKEKNRTRNLGRLLAMNFFGLTLGALFSGVFQDVLDINSAFASILVLHGTAILLTIVLVPGTKEKKDSMAKNNKEGAEEASYALCDLFRPSNVKETIAVMFKSRSENKRIILIILFIMSVVNQTCRAGEVDVKFLFVTRSPLSWPKSWYGYLLSSDYATMGFGLLLIMPLLCNKLELSDVTIMMLAIGSQIARLIFMGVSDELWTIVVSVVVGVLTGVVSSALRSMIGKAVHVEEAGKIFSLVSCGETLSKFLGPLVFVNIYNATADIFPGISFLVEVSIFVIMLVVLGAMFKQLRALHNLLTNITVHVVSKSDQRQSITNDKQDIPPQSNFPSQEDKKELYI